MRRYKSYDRPLTARECEVCDLVMKGLSAKEIARKLGIGHRTRIASCAYAPASSSTGVSWR